MFSVMDIRTYSKILLIAAPLAFISDLADAIADPSLSTLGALAASSSHALVLLLWLHVTKGYALFAKTHGEL